MKYPRVKLDEDVYEAVAKLVGDHGVEEFVNEALRGQLGLLTPQNIQKEPE
jgi:hypothetical protein